jgi:hypothetical protein
LPARRGQRQNLCHRTNHPLATLEDEPAGDVEETADLVDQASGRGIAVQVVIGYC